MSTFSGALGGQSCHLVFGEVAPVQRVVQKIGPATAEQGLQQHEPGEEQAVDTAPVNVERAGGAGQVVEAGGADQEVRVDEPEPAGPVEREVAELGVDDVGQARNAERGDRAGKRQGEQAPGDRDELG
jgi:hypothetical protein